MDKHYLILNKPLGYVCSAVSDSHKTIYQLLPEDLQYLVQNAKRGQRLHTVGRLDSLTTGLILITTDGKFSSHITNPLSNISKVYEVVLEHSVTKEEQSLYIEKAKQGLLLPADKKASEEMSGKAIIEFLDERKCRITISEGKFHQVRRTFTALGNCVKELKRIKIGKLSLPIDLKEGCYREMTKEEIELFIEK